MKYHKRKLRADIGEIAAQRNVTARKISIELCVTVSTAYRWLYHKSQPNEIFHDALAAMLGLTVDELFE